MKQDLTFKKKRSDSQIDVSRVLDEFRKSEASSSPRKGTFKIHKPFEEALDKILKTKLEPKKLKPAKA